MKDSPLKAQQLLVTENQYSSINSLTQKKFSADLQLLSNELNRLKIPESKTVLILMERCNMEGNTNSQIAAIVFNQNFNVAPLANFRVPYFDSTSGTTTHFICNTSLLPQIFHFDTDKQKVPASPFTSPQALLQLCETNHISHEKSSGFQRVLDNAEPFTSKTSKKNKYHTLCQRAILFDTKHISTQRSQDLLLPQTQYSLESFCRKAYPYLLGTAFALAFPTTTAIVAGCVIAPQIIAKSYKALSNQLTLTQELNSDTLTAAEELLETESVFPTLLSSAESLRTNSAMLLSKFNATLNASAHALQLFVQYLKDTQYSLNHRYTAITHNLPILCDGNSQALAYNVSTSGYSTTSLVSALSETCKQLKSTYEHEALINTTHIAANEALEYISSSTANLESNHIEEAYTNLQSAYNITQELLQSLPLFIVHIESTSDETNSDITTTLNMHQWLSGILCTLLITQLVHILAKALYSQCRYSSISNLISKLTIVRTTPTFTLQQLTPPRIQHSTLSTPNLSTKSFTYSLNEAPPKNTKANGSQNALNSNQSNSDKVNQRPLFSCPPPPTEPPPINIPPSDPENKGAIPAAFSTTSSNYSTTANVTAAIPIPNRSNRQNSFDDELEPPLNFDSTNSLMADLTQDSNWQDVLMHTISAPHMLTREDSNSLAGSISSSNTSNSNRSSSQNSQPELIASGLPVSSRSSLESRSKEETQQPNTRPNHPYINDTTILPSGPQKTPPKKRSSKPPPLKTDINFRELDIPLDKTFSSNTFNTRTSTSLPWGTKVPEKMPSPTEAVTTSLRSQSDIIDSRKDTEKSNKETQSHEDIQSAPTSPNKIEETTSNEQPYTELPETTRVRIGNTEYTHSPFNTRRKIKQIPIFQHPYNMPKSTSQTFFENARSNGAQPNLYETILETSNEQKHSRTPSTKTHSSLHSSGYSTPNLSMSNEKGVLDYLERHEHTQLETIATLQQKLVGLENSRLWAENKVELAENVYSEIKRNKYQTNDLIEKEYQEELAKLKLVNDAITKTSNELARARNIELARKLKTEIEFEKRVKRLREPNNTNFTQNTAPTSTRETSSIGRQTSASSITKKKANPVQKILSQLSGSSQSVNRAGLKNSPSISKLTIAHQKSRGTPSPKMPRSKPSTPVKPNFLSPMFDGKVRSHSFTAADYIEKSDLLSGKRTSLPNSIPLKTNASPSRANKKRVGSYDQSSQETITTPVTPSHFTPPTSAYSEEELDQVPSQLVHRRIKKSQIGKRRTRNFGSVVDRTTRKKYEKGEITDARKGNKMVTTNSPKTPKISPKSESFPIV